MKPPRGESLWRCNGFKSKVFISDRCIIDTYAQRIMGGPRKPCMYKSDTNHLIPHHFDDGAAQLAIKLLKFYDGA